MHGGRVGRRKHFARDAVAASSSDAGMNCFGTLRWLGVFLLAAGSGALRAAEAAELRFDPVRLQRLDAIGQITSGVAHDFNNLLSVVLTNARLLLRKETRRIKKVSS